MLNRAFSSLGCPELSLEEVLALAERHGVPGVELRALEGTVDLVSVFAARYGTPAGLAARLRDCPVRIVGLGTSVRLMAPRKGDRAALTALAPWAEAADVPYLRVFDGGERGDASEFAHAHSLLGWWRDARPAVGLIVETHDGIADPAVLARFLDAVPDVALLWDAHHTWKKGGQDPVETWKLVAPRTRHIHVKDSVSQPGPRLPYSYVLPGAGEFPMRALCTALSGYDGVLSLEWERLWHPDLPPMDEALRAAGGWWSPNG